MNTGLYSPVSLEKYASRLSSLSCNFIGRLYCLNEVNCLTLSEAIAISKSGETIVARWYNGFPINKEYFSFEKGESDAISAYNIANLQIKQPKNTTIYFSVDYLPPLEDINAPITRYFEGIRSGFNTIDKKNPIYKIGIYGSSLACKIIKSNDLAEYTWVTNKDKSYAPGTYFDYFNIVQGWDLKLKSWIADFPDDDVIANLNEVPNADDGSFIIMSGK